MLCAVSPDNIIIIIIIIEPTSPQETSMEKHTFTLYHGQWRA